MKLTTIAVLLGIGAVPLTAPAQDAAAPIKSKKAPKPKQVCRSVTVTGSHMGVSTCHTQAEWDEIDQASRSSVNDFQLQQPQH